MLEKMPQGSYYIGGVVIKEPGEERPGRRAHILPCDNHCKVYELADCSPVYIDIL